MEEMLHRLVDRRRGADSAQRRPGPAPTRHLRPVSKDRVIFLPCKHRTEISPGYLEPDGWCRTRCYHCGEMGFMVLWPSPEERAEMTELRDLLWQSHATCRRWETAFLLVFFAAVSGLLGVALLLLGH